MSNANEPAYPHFDTGETGTRTGLTKLELFTMAAMQGICVNAGRNGHTFDLAEGMARDAVKIARAHLAELEK